jgi:hypothetical protein
MLASANARASLLLLAYSWGSALGSVTTLWTLPWLPASWVAMLPQKFCPATILSVAPDPADEDPHPDSRDVRSSGETAAMTILREMIWEPSGKTLQGG